MAQKIYVPIVGVVQHVKADIILAKKRLVASAVFSMQIVMFVIVIR